MHDERLPCKLCGCAILQATSLRNNGLCEPCAIKRRVAERKNIKQSASLEMDYNLLPIKGISENGFIKNLFLFSEPTLMNPLSVARRFLEYCEPILQQSDFSGLFNTTESLAYRLIQEIPRPFRELMALYQAWGIIQSDDYVTYASYACEKFDSEVDNGLIVIENSQCVGVLTEARILFNRHKGLSAEVDNLIWAVSGC